MKHLSRRLAEQAGLHGWLQEWQAQLLSRRRFLLRMAGGSLAAMLPFGIADAVSASTSIDDAARWKILDAVQRHMLPSETDAPGAAEIHALDYLRFIVADESIDAEDRAFLLQGAGWLEDMAQQMTGTSFTALDEDGRERVLRRIEGSSAGHNWLSQMLLYLIEALLSDPAYGGNAQRAGWRWLAHIPGFPSPPPDKLYPELLKR
ncbi:MAG: gluconate 2-dehydrogenase subunit 3 family protein [Chromatiaceae bacterium]|nr:gluconate 2-dehydrogenase subunit 3 family protein [Chromatiaceae bacterium]MCP5315111.1 gluconate 2-dehydrogenase subunit 3 family protein [Chromatiaceae bacterium]